MASVLRPQDTLARVGGDEFVIIMEPQNRAHLTKNDTHSAGQPTGPPSGHPGQDLATAVAERLLSVVDSADDGVIDGADDRGVRRPRRLVAGGALVGGVAGCSAW